MTSHSVYRHKTQHPLRNGFSTRIWRTYSNTDKETQNLSYKYLYDPISNRVNQVVSIMEEECQRQNTFLVFPQVHEDFDISHDYIVQLLINDYQVVQNTHVKVVEENAETYQIKLHMWRGMMNTSYLLQILLSFQGGNTPQSEEGPTSAHAWFRPPSPTKAKIVSRVS